MHPHSVCFQVTTLSGLLDMPPASSLATPWSSLHIATWENIIPLLKPSKTLRGWQDPVRSGPCLHVEFHLWPLSFVFCSSHTVFPKHTKLDPTSGPLHILFFLPGILSSLPRICVLHSFLLFRFSPKVTSLQTLSLSKVDLPTFTAPPQPPPSISYFLHNSYYYLIILSLVVCLLICLDCLPH